MGTLAALVHRNQERLNDNVEFVKQLADSIGGVLKNNEGMTNKISNFSK